MKVHIFKWIIIGTLIIIVVAAIVITFTSVQNSKNTSQSAINASFDVVQVSGQKTRPEGIVDAIVNLLGGKKPEILSLTDNHADSVMIKGKPHKISLYNTDIYHKLRKRDQYGSHGLIGGFREVTHGSTVIFINNESLEMDDVVRLVGDSSNRLTKTTCINKFLNKHYIVYSLSQEWMGSYFSESAARGVYAMFAYIQAEYEISKIPFIVTGNFNLQGWDSIRRHVFGDSVWSSGKFKICTTDTMSNGVAGSSGIITHRSLCSRVIYSIKLLYPPVTSQQYILIATLFEKGRPPGESLDDFTVKTTNFLKTRLHNNYINDDLSIPIPDITANASSMVRDDETPDGYLISIEHLFNKLFNSIDKKRNVD
ncbi:MAG: hypothetical protein MUO31_05390 [Thermodesulfovibrionales bacterium]|nr:hypothetical protein [Thermodesulfovibrionales bacterium]